MCLYLYRYFFPPLRMYKLFSSLLIAVLVVTAVPAFARSDNSGPGNSRNAEKKMMQMLRKQKRMDMRAERKGSSRDDDSEDSSGKKECAESHAADRNQAIRDAQRAYLTILREARKVRWEAIRAAFELSNDDKREAIREAQSDFRSALKEARMTRNIGIRDAQKEFKDNRDCDDDSSSSSSSSTTSSSVSSSSTSSSSSSVTSSMSSSSSDSSSSSSSSSSDSSSSASSDSSSSSSS